MTNSGGTVLCNGTCSVAPPPNSACGTADLTTVGTVTPISAAVGVPVTLSATIKNAGTAATSAGFTDLFEINLNTQPVSFASIPAAGLKTYTSAALGAGVSNTATASYTFTTAGTYYVSACANTNASNVNSITESSYANNCSAWVAVTVGGTGPTATLTATPSSIAPGGSSVLSWSSTNAVSCTGDTNFSTGASSPTSGTATVLPSSTTTYAVTCTDSTGVTASAQTTVAVSAQPDLQAGDVGAVSATVGVPVTLSAPITNAGTGDTGGTFPDLFEINPNTQPASFASIPATGLVTYTSGALAAGANNTASISYTFPTVGTYYVRACAGMNTGGAITVATDSNVNNNCSPHWTVVSVAAVAPVCAANAGLTCTPANVCGKYNIGQIGCDGATCSVSAPPDSDCVPMMYLLASPQRVASGKTTTLSWSAQYVTSCTLTGPGGVVYATNTLPKIGDMATSSVPSAVVSGAQTYKLTCDGTSVQVNVMPLPKIKEI